MYAISSCILFYQGNVLTESDTRVLALVLSEYLPNLEESGLNLEQDIRITKEELVMHLRKIDKNELVEIFSKDNGKIQVSEQNNVYIISLVQITILDS